MSVYVDTLFPCERRPNWWWPFACHLYADTTEELHAFAAKLSLEREWFQDKPFFPHYDLTPSKRKVAVHLGAVEAARQHGCLFRHNLREAARAAGEPQP